MMTETLKLAIALLERESVTPNDQGCQALLAERLAKIGFEIKHFPKNNVSNLWARRKQHTPLFCFAGHTDVVPTGDLSLWHSPPFAPTVRNNQLFARGSADMKSSIAAMVTACERFVAKFPDHASSIALLITSDEEGDAIDGTQAVLQALQKSNEIPTWCLVGEASSEKTLGDIIKVGRRGSMTGFLKIIGKQGHVAYPQLAKNPIHLSFSPLQKIANIIWPKAHPPFPATSLQFANIHAGVEATNVIPGILTANFNLRFSPQTSPEMIRATIEQILQTSDCEYEITWRVSGKPFYTPPPCKLIQTVSSVIEKTLNITPRHSTSGGTSDGRFFAEFGTEVVEIGPQNASIHQVNENINLDELENLSILYENILINLCL